MERVLPILEPNRSVRIALLPEGEDPDTLVRRPDGTAAVNAVIARAVPLIDYLWAVKTAGGMPSTPEGRAGLRRRRRHGRRCRGCRGRWGGSERNEGKN